MTLFRFVRAPFVLIAGVLFASCTLGQNYKRPAIETPSTYRSASGETSTASLADLQWFELFRDQTLTELVKTALKQNFELRIAAERVLQARAAYGITRAAQLPSVDVLSSQGNGDFTLSHKPCQASPATFSVVAAAQALKPNDVERGSVP